MPFVSVCIVIKTGLESGHHDTGKDIQEDIDTNHIKDNIIEACELVVDTRHSALHRSHSNSSNTSTKIIGYPNSSSKSNTCILVTSSSNTSTKMDQLLPTEMVKRERIALEIVSKFSA